MSTVPAQYYDGRTSATRPVTVEVKTGADGAPWLFIVGNEPIRQVALREITFESNVGVASRLVELPGGGTLEFRDHDALDDVLYGAGHLPASRWVTRLEERWAIALACLVVTAAAIGATVRYGIPALALQAAFMMPPEVGTRIESQGIELADRDLFKPSLLSTTRQQDLRAKFDAMARDLGLEKQTNLLFRSGGRLGANAFTLPGGSIVLTDELVDLSEHDDELRAVFAHEFGHVYYRHTMRILLQNSATAILMVGLLGDVTAAGSLAASVPTMLAHAAYSRDFEREADAYAREWLRSNEIPLSRMDDILKRLAARHGDETWGYLSTHPPLAERLRR